MTLENTNRDHALFEEWFGDNCPPDECERMFEKNAIGDYKFMQARLAYLAFSAGIQAVKQRENDIRVILAQTPELNMANFDDIDVERVNNALIQINQVVGEDSPS